MLSRKTIDILPGTTIFNCNRRNVCFVLGPDLYDRLC